MIGDQFVLRTAGFELAVRLTEVSEVSGGIGGGRAAFALLFLGPGEPIWRRQI